MSRSVLLRKSCMGLAAAVALVWLSGCASSVDLKTKDTRYENEDDIGGRPDPVVPGDGSADDVPTISAGYDSYAGTGPAGATDTVYFAFDSFRIPQKYLSDVQQHASYMVNDGARTMMIEGHADERGSSEYNLALGQKRAEAVRKALVLLGASEANIEAVSYGEERPAETGSNEAAWAKNRRAQMLYK